MKLHRLTSSLRRAFTLVEVLVVISIFVLLLAIAVPAFSAMLYSSEQSLVENSIRIAVSSARNYAARSPAGQDAAAVFLYDTASKKTSIVTCTFAGTLMDDGDVSGTDTVVQRDVFAVAPGVEPIQLTAGWTIRGFAPAFTIDNEWYESTYAGLESRGNWILPETSFYNKTRADSGQQRQSFIIRFEGGTGTVKLSSPNTALVHIASESMQVHDASNWPADPDGAVPSRVNPENESDDYRFVRRILSWPGPAASGLPFPERGATLDLNAKREILGNISTDSILCKTVGQIAVCSERRLARAIEVEVNAATGTIYNDANQPTFLTGVNIDNVNAWISGFDTSGNPQDTDCRIFTIQRYLGWLQEATGTQNGMGVGS